MDPRDRFEQWADEVLGKSKGTREDNAVRQAAWEGWQAGRASMLEEVATLLKNIPL